MDSTILDRLEEAFADELALLPDLGSLEAAVAAKLHTLGLGLLKRVLHRRPSGYEGSRRSCGCGGRMRFVSYRRRQVHTVFGWLEVSRAYYHCPACQRGEAPYDRAAGLGTEEVSPALAKACCLLAVDDSFAESGRKVAELLGETVSAKTIERLMHQVGGRVLQEQDRQLEVFRQEREPPLAQAQPRRLYATADGTTAHERDGWHEVKAGRLYWEDDELRRHDWTVGRFDDSQTFGWHLWLAACRCGLREAEEVVFLGDGAAWIRSEQSRHFQRATFIVDWYHTSEHVWDCGKALFGEGTAATEAWAGQRETWLWEGRTQRLLNDLAQAIPRHRGGKREALESLRRYVGTNEQEMRYDVFRSKGYDIGSGAVEGACNHVIKKRLKQSGMIWTRQGSSTTLALRVVWLNGQWSQLWASKPLAA